MRRMPTRRSSWTGWWWSGLLLLAAAVAVGPQRVTADDSPAATTTPAATDDAAIRALIRSYAKAIESRQVDAMAPCFAPSAGLRDRLAKEWQPIFQGYATISLDYAVQTVAIRGDRGLVRENFSMTGDRGVRHSTILEGVVDLTVERTAGGWGLTERAWHHNSIEREITLTIAQMQNAVFPGVLQLVVDLRGGAWQPQRCMWWRGTAGPSGSMDESQAISAAATVLKRQEQHGEPGQAQVFLQRDGSGWSCVGGLWQPNLPLETKWAAGESIIRSLRQQLLQDFADPQLHKRLADALTTFGSFAAALEEYQKAEWLAPGTVPADVLQDAKSRSQQDPRLLAELQSRFEQSVGLAEDHPLRVIGDIRRELALNPVSPDLHAMLGLELGRLGADNESLQEFNQVTLLMRHGLRTTPYFQIVYRLLQQQVALSDLKPSELIRSSLFTVRHAPNEPNLLPVLAALERAQHVVYADFGVPMSATEVVVFPGPTSFARYTKALQGQLPAEFTAAYTDGEQIVTYSHPGWDSVSVLGHEYGHVAVQRLARGYEVPTWFNEGIACVVQGGYWNAAVSVARASAQGTLLSYDELVRWSVEGERGLLAYAQVSDMVSYMQRIHGQAAVFNIVRLIGNGLPVDAAFSRSIGMGPQEFYRAWLSKVQNESVGQ